MKFKKDGAGWRDLKIVKDGTEFQLSIPDRRSKYTLDAAPFISIAENYQYADVRLTRRQLRTLANKILKELDR